MSRRMSWTVWISLAVAVVMAAMPAPSSAQSGFSVADNAAFKAYVLDAGKVNRFIAGLSALAMAKQSDDAIAEDYERMDNEDGTSLAQLKARLTRYPRIFAFFQRQNLTPDDAILIPLSHDVRGHRHRRARTDGRCGQPGTDEFRPLERRTCAASGRGERRLGKLELTAALIRAAAADRTLQRPERWRRCPLRFRARRLDQLVEAAELHAHDNGGRAPGSGNTSHARRRTARSVRLSRSFPSPACRSRPSSLVPSTTVWPWKS